MRRDVLRGGATKVEYALMLLFISVGSLLVIGAMGQHLSSLLDGTGSAFEDASQGGPSESQAFDPGSDSGSDSESGNSGRARRRGNPGQGNVGNDKTVGNAPQD